MTLSDFKTYAEIAEIVFKILAMIVAGAWAIYGLVVFRQRQAAITALRKAESEAASLELTAKRRAVLDITISHKVDRDTTATGYVLTIQVMISNGGVGPAYMRFEEDNPPLRVQRVDFDESGSMTFTEPPVFLLVRDVSDPTKSARGRVIRAGGTSRLSSAVRLRTAGMYSVSFRVPMDASNSQAMNEAGADPTRRHHWTATSFVGVGLPPMGTDAPAGPAGRGL